MKCLVIKLYNRIGSRPHTSKFFKKIPYMLKFAKEIETFCIYIAVKVFLKTPIKGIYNKWAKAYFQFQTNVSAKLLEFSNVNVTLLT